MNVKEAGIEKYILEEIAKRNIKNYFLLDVEFPYLYKAARMGIKEIAIRFSEDEPIELAKNYISLTDWVWIDTNTQLPVNAQNIEILNNFKTCLVCPERWNRPQDILPYRLQMQKLRWQPTAVMTNIACMHEWEKSL